jgi:transposase
MERARIVLAIADDRTPTDVAREVGTTRATVYKWLRRFDEQRIAGIEREAPGRGRKRTITDAQVADIERRTLQDKPPGAARWTRQSMADVAGVSPSSVGRVWRAHGVKPQRARSFNAGRPLADIVGLYFDPPVNAVVFTIDKESQVPVLDPAAQGLAPKRGRAGTPHYKRHGTTLFATLRYATGELPDGRMVWPRRRDFLHFLRQVESHVDATRDIHVLVDDYARYKHPAMDLWLKRHPRVRLHLVAESCSWIDVVERFFRGLTDSHLRRGSFGGVPVLVAAMKEYLAQRYERARRFVWTAKAREA